MARNKPITGNLMPERDGVQNLGGPNNYFGKAYIRELVGGAIAAGGGAGNKPYATVVVAASDSGAVDKANADYVCDGTSDQVEINNAFGDVLSSGTGGGKVLLLEGTFYIDGSIFIGDFTILEGQGQGTEIRLPSGYSGTLQMIYGSFTSGAIIKNLGIRQLGSGSTTYGIYLNGTDKIIIEDVSFYNITGAFSEAVEIKGQAQHVLITGCDVDISQGYGFYISETFPNRYIIIDNCTFTSVTKNDIYSLNTEFIQITNNTFIKLGAGAYANYLNTNLYFEISNNLYDRCGNINVAGGGITTIACTQGYINNNIIYRSHNPIRLVGSGRRDSYINAAYNIIRRFGQWGISSDQADKINIHNNIIYAEISGSYGISLDTKDSKVHDNLIYGNSVMSNGFDLLFDCENLDLEDNKVYNTTSDGYICSITANLKLARNTAKSCGRYGFLISGSGGAVFDNFDITGNTAYLNSQHGFFINPLSNSKFTNNRAWDNGQQTNNAYDNFQFAGNSDDNMITNNIARRNSALTNKPRYGMNIAASTCDNNISNDNDLRNSGQTANYNDAGTGTLGTNWT